jgi:hypothetical protein
VVTGYNLDVCSSFDAEDGRVTYGMLVSGNRVVDARTDKCIEAATAKTYDVS